MTPDDLVARVEQMLDADKTIPPKLRNELLLSLLMESSRADKVLREDLKAVRDDIADVRAAIDAQVQAMRGDMINLKDSTAKEFLSVRAEVQTVRSKSVLIWIENNKRLAGILFALFVLTANLWFDSGVLRGLVAWLIGVPVDLLP